MNKPGFTPQKYHTKTTKPDSTLETAPPPIFLNLVSRYGSTHTLYYLRMFQNVNKLLRNLISLRQHILLLYIFYLLSFFVFKFQAHELFQHILVNLSKICFKSEEILVFNMSKLLFSSVKVEGKKNSSNLKEIKL